MINLQAELKLLYVMLVTTHVLNVLLEIIKLNVHLVVHQNKEHMLVENVYVNQDILMMDQIKTVQFVHINV